MLHDPLGQDLARIVPRVLLEETAQEISAPGASKPIEKTSWSRQSGRGNSRILMYTFGLQARRFR